MSVTATSLFLTYLKLRLALAQQLPREPLDVLLEWLEAPHARQPRATIGTASRVIRVAERVAGRLVPRSADTCLYRALARYGALASCGIPSTFVLGLPPPGGAGHAWVEVNGIPLNEPGTPKFTRVLERRWPAPSAHAL